MRNSEIYRNAFSGVRPSEEAVQRIVELPMKKAVKFKLRSVLAAAVLSALLAGALSAGAEDPVRENNPDEKDPWGGSVRLVVGGETAGQYQVVRSNPSGRWIETMDEIMQDGAEQALSGEESGFIAGEIAQRGPGGEWIVEIRSVGTAEGGGRE